MPPCWGSTHAPTDPAVSVGTNLLYEIAGIHFQAPSVKRSLLSERGNLSLTTEEMVFAGWLESLEIVMIAWVALMNLCEIGFFMEPTGELRGMLRRD